MYEYNVLTQLHAHNVFTQLHAHNVFTQLHAHNAFCQCQCQLFNKIEEAPENKKHLIEASNIF